MNCSVDLAESDFIYTETLMQRGKIDYKDKNILILGGGDGALLNELLKESPKFVTMVEVGSTISKNRRHFFLNIVRHFD